MVVLEQRAGPARLSVEPAAAAGPAARGAARSRRRLLAALHVLAALLFFALLLPRALGGAAAEAAAAGSKGAAAVAGHDCPHFTGGSILDLPDTTDCRRLMSKLVSCLPHQGQAVVDDAPSADCCKNAARWGAPRLRLCCAGHAAAYARSLQA